MPILTVNLNNGTSLRFELSETEAMIGRTDECDIRISNAFISKKHALLKLVAPSVYELIDLGGKNGSYINGIRVHRHTLRDGDEIHLGGYEAPVRAIYQQEDTAFKTQKAARKGEAVRPVVRKLSADAFEGAGETSPLDPDEFTSTQEVTESAKRKTDPVDLLEAVIRRARLGESSKDLLADLERVRDLIGSESEED